MTIRWGTRRHRAESQATRPTVAVPVGARAAGERGFTVLESTIALGVIFAVMLGLFSSLDAGIRGLLTGRQRSGATAVAKEVIEKARSVPFDDVGHDVENDTTLTSDPKITGTPPALSYAPEGISPEGLVAAVDPHFPVHQWTQDRDGAQYHVSVYVTWNFELVGDRRKRLTVEVVHTPAQFDPDAVENAVRLSTFLTAGAGAPICVADCESVVSNQATGLVNVSNGSVIVSGTIPGSTFQRTQVDMPSAIAEFAANSRGDGTALRRNASASARGSRASMTLSSGSPSSSGCTVSGTTGDCAGVLAATNVDNDGGSPAPVHQVDGPRYASEGSLAAGLSGGNLTTALTAATGEVVAKSSVDSCVSCSPVVGDGDRFPHTEGTGAASPLATVGTGDIGVLQGNLVSMDGGAGARAVIDDDPVSGKELVTSKARLAMGGLKLANISGTNLELPAGFTSAATVGAVDVTATAQVGPTAASPTVTGPTVSVEIWDTLSVGVQGYRTVDITVGTSLSTTANASFTVLDTSTGVVNTVTLETAVTAGPKQTSCDTGCAGRAEARVQNWLRVLVRMTVTEDGVTKADLTLDATYGSLTAVAEYKAVT